MDSRAIGIVCVLLSAAVFFVYGGVGSHSFLTYDDDEYVTANALVVQGLTGAGVREAFTGYTAGNWHPITMLSHMLDCEVLGIHAGRHIVMNVVLHSLSCVLLFLFLVRVTNRVWPSVAVAGLFALHPLHVEAVVWVSQRKSVLSGLFFMVGLHVYLCWLGSRGRCRPPAYVLLMAVYALGLLSKPMLVTFPFVLLLLDVWPLKRLTGLRASARMVLVEKLPLLAMATVASAATLRAQTVMHAVASRSDAPLSLRFANAVCSYAWYLWKAVFPVRLGVFYPFHYGVRIGWLLLSAAMLAGISWLAWHVRRTRPYILFGWCWYLVMLVPVIGVVQVGGQARADRYAYLPLIGIFVALAWFVCDSLRSCPSRTRRGIGAAVVGALCFLPLLTAAQAARWRDGEILFRHSLRVCGDSTVLRNNLGTTLLQQGRLREALNEFAAAVALDPDYARGHNNIGTCLLRLGRPREAVVPLRKALELHPDAPEISANLGTALVRTGQFEEGIRLMESAARAMPLFAHSYAELADAYVRLGDPQRAAAYYRRALAIRPDLHEARRRLDAIRVLVPSEGRASAE